MLAASIEKARQINPDKSTHSVQSLDAYFIAHCETAFEGKEAHG
jgi:hypothetical protein